MPEYPNWMYYPPQSRAAEWVADFLRVVSDARASIDSVTVDHLTSDQVLAFLRPGLSVLGYEVEAGKHLSERIRRPVLFGEAGRARVTYEIDAIHEQLGVLVEVEAGRGARGNAVYRDLVRTSLIVDAEYLALGLMQEYRHQSGGRGVTVSSYDEARDLLDAVYASGRLRLPFKGLLLFGY